MQLLLIYKEKNDFSFTRWQHRSAIPSFAELLRRLSLLASRGIATVSCLSVCPSVLVLFVHLQRYNVSDVTWLVLALQSAHEAPGAASGTHIRQILVIFSRPVADIYDLSTDTTVSPSLGNVHTYFGFCTPFCFQVMSPYVRDRQTDGRTDGH